MFACAKFAFSRGTERHEIYIEYIHWNSANIVHSIEYSVNSDYSASIQSCHETESFSSLMACG